MEPRAIQLHPLHNTNETLKHHIEKFLKKKYRKITLKQVEALTEEANKSLKETWENTIKLVRKDE